MASSFSDGTGAFDHRGAISSLAFTPTRAAGFGSEARQALSEGQSRVQALRQSAS
jgi:hypothetical protein